MKKHIISNILLSPEAQDGGNQVEADPFDVPAADTNTDFPLIKPGIKDLEIVNGEPATSKSGNDMLVFKLKTTADDYDTKGEVLNAGYPLYHRIVITPTEDRTAQRISKDIALLLKAAGQPTLTPRQLMNDPELLNGAIVRAKVVVQKATDEFPESNSIKSFVLE
jgi:hypothetical protein